MGKNRKKSVKKKQSKKKTPSFQLLKAISECSSESNLTVDVRFGFLELGSLCNASESNAFTRASCHITNITNERNGHYFLEFIELFRPGLELLEKYKTDRWSPNAREENAIEKLESFLREKGQHQKCLNRVFLNKENISEVEISVTLAEHLLKKLAPGQQYLVDNGASVKPCSCGYAACRSDPKTGNTDIGHEDGWHGAIDIVLSDSVEEQNPSAGKRKEQKSATTGTTGDSKEEKPKPFTIKKDSPSERNIIEVKKSLSDKKYEAMNQSIAQTIVFSFLQNTKISHIRFVPNILIDPNKFRVIMYDAVNDILICSQPLDIFTSASLSTRRLNVPSIFILWMVLHYEMFAKDLESTFSNKGIEMTKFQAKFKERVKTKHDLYKNKLRFIEKSLQTKGKYYFPESNNLTEGNCEDVFN